jgi:hypothetical protein
MDSFFHVGLAGSVDCLTSDTPSECPANCGAVSYGPNFDPRLDSSHREWDASEAPSSRQSTQDSQSQQPGMIHSPTLRSHLLHLCDVCSQHTRRLRGQLGMTHQVRVTLCVIPFCLRVPRSFYPRVGTLCLGTRNALPRPREPMVTKLFSRLLCVLPCRRCRAV